MSYSPSGSYRLEHVLAFLQRWLRPWTSERAAAGDWWLLYLDAYAAHLDPSVAEFAWSRGYVVVYHGGCTTGICQVNDTDLHAQLQKIYMDMETESFFQQQLVDPGNIGRSRQQASALVRYSTNCLQCSQVQCRWATQY